LTAVLEALGGSVANARPASAVWRLGSFRPETVARAVSEGA
jgi:hypothetical protein